VARAARLPRDDHAARHDRRLLRGLHAAHRLAHRPSCRREGLRRLRAGHCPEPVPARSAALLLPPLAPGTFVPLARSVRLLPLPQGAAPNPSRPPLHDPGGFQHHPSTVRLDSGNVAKEGEPCPWIPITCFSPAARHGWCASTTSSCWGCWCLC